MPLTGYERMKRFLQRHPGYYNDYDRERIRRKRASNPEYVARGRVKALEYYYTHKAKQIENHRKYVNNHRDLVNSNQRIYNSKNRALIQARNEAYYYVPIMNYCEVCGSENLLQRHHEDYNDSLNVITVCRRCHIGFNIRS